MKVSEEIQQRFICPRTKVALQQNGDWLSSDLDPSIRYPILEGTPVLINDENSLFSVDDFTHDRDTTIIRKQSQFKRMIKKALPGISLNLKAAKNYDNLAAMLPDGAKILIIGEHVLVAGMESIYANKTFETVGTDVTIGPKTKVICDAHDIPFADETFDCVIIQAVLEHVLDPVRCVSEVHRVLKSTGIVYAETPFMQQVHMKQFDFTRFSHLGHRRLFRHFEEIESGPSGGPGMALAWAWTYFVESFAFNRLSSSFLTLFATLTSFHWKYFDYLLLERPRAYDAASGYFFIGKKSDTCLSDKELIGQFRGQL